MSLEVSTAIGGVVTAGPRRNRVPETDGFDYCCNERYFLAAATHCAGLNLDEVATALDSPDSAPARHRVHRENAALAHDIRDVVGELFREIRALTDETAGLTDACNSYRGMLTGPEEMEFGLHRRVPEESNIMSPRIIEPSQRLAGG